MSVTEKEQKEKDWSWGILEDELYMGKKASMFQQNSYYTYRARADFVW